MPQTRSILSFDTLVPISNAPLNHISCAFLYDTVACNHISTLFASPKGEGFQPSPKETLIAKAEYLAFYYENNELVAIGAIKRPDKNYRKDVFKEAGSDRSPKNFNFELGWLNTKPAFRKQGIIKDIVSKLLAVLPKEAIYATTSHTYIESFLGKFGFIQSGLPYKSKRGDYNLFLLIKN